MRRPQNQLIAIQRAWYYRLRDQAKKYVGGLSPKLKLYFQEYQKDFASIQGITTWRELLAKLHRANVILCGDYHTLPQSQEAALRILKATQESHSAQGRPLGLGLEMVLQEEERQCQRFLRRQLSSQRLSEVLSFHRRWGVPWKHYEPLFQYAQQQQLSLVGLFWKGTLAQRDRYAAQRITETLQQGKSIFTLMGDMHLGKAHLVRELKSLWAKEIEKKPNLVVVHQNAERVFWKMAEQGISHRSQIVRVEENTYCLLNTPPWAKVLSQLQQLGAEEDFNPAFEIEAIEQTVQDLRQIQAAFFAIADPASWKHQVLTPFGKSLPRFLAAHFEDRPKEYQFLKGTLLRHPSFYIPRPAAIFLGSPSFSHLAHLSGILLLEEYQPLHSVSLSAKQDFFRWVWIEALGFLASRVVNPARRAPQIHQLEAAAKDFPVARKLLQILRQESMEQKFRVLFPKNASVGKNVLYYSLARSLGKILGDALFEGVVEGYFPLKELRELYTGNTLHSKQVAFEKYRTWVLRTDALNLRNTASLR